MSRLKCVCRKSYSVKISQNHYYENMATTVVSKIHENRCRQTYIPVHVQSNSGNDYFIYHLLQCNIHRNFHVSMKNSIVLLLCIFEPSVRRYEYYL